MGSRGRPLFDLNETPVEDEEEIDESPGFQPQKVLPSLNSCSSDLLVASVGPPSIANNNAFSHASTVSGFQPFVRSRVSPSLDRNDDQSKEKRQNPDVVSLTKISSDIERKEDTLLDSGGKNAQVTDKEEGEWSDGECLDPCVNNRDQKMSLASGSKPLSEHEFAPDLFSAGISFKQGSNDSSPAHQRKIQSSHSSAKLEPVPSDNMVSSSQNMNGNAEGNLEAQGDVVSVPKQKEVKGVEASYAFKCANNHGKHKLDEHKEAMLGKKRSRKTMFLNIEDAKQAGAVKSSTPRRQSIPTSGINRSIKANRIARFPTDRNGEKQNEHAVKDQNQDF